MVTVAPCRLDRGASWKWGVTAGGLVLAHGREPSEAAARARAEAVVRELE